MDPKRILIVDDEEDVLKVLEKRLLDAGYAVLKAKNGKEAIAVTRREHPNLVLMDINMPEMGGSEAGEILKKDPDTKDIPILYLTCLVTKDEEKKESHAIGRNFFIAKPFESAELLEQIKAHLSSKDNPGTKKVPGA
ncbi:MAG TPA: response regulator [Candidatus Omnitrophota bacterium]|nr:response regulator [Candidatus Omnitrophota bacterium]HPD85405.1 response regulator [Candidatus Omnitrophota bacterium]HRZ04094.1 response regulator [Candidatus Omnitrophota bacterium]